ncbi:MAG: FAD-dependent oxidoreductase, partial [Anaerolineae bacterium]|nr:FAD-dependent oxidoreductase [Anaerolineae bacterium]
GEEEVEAMRGLLQRFLPGLDGPFMRAEVCLYTNAPDGHFLLDRHPEHPQVFVVSPCSGHGFKFSSAIGELVAETIQEDAICYDRALFGWRW